MTYMVQPVMLAMTPDHGVVIMNQIGLCPPLNSVQQTLPQQPLYFLPAIYSHPNVSRPPESDSPAESPDSVNGKKVYNCQRCLNHGITVKRRNHKTVCPFNSCQCSMCEMVSRRSELNNEFALECEEGGDTDVEVDVVDLESNSGDNEETAADLVRAQSRAHSLTANTPTTETATESAATKVRDPRCQQCAAHGKNFPLKNHKKICPFRKCECKKCKIVFRRRNLMAKQIKLRRQQKQKKQMESAALELRKQLEKMAERERQQAAIFSFFPLPSVSSVIPHQSHSAHLTGHISFHSSNNCWPHYGCHAWPQHSSGPSIPPMPLLNLPSTSGTTSLESLSGQLQRNSMAQHVVPSSKHPSCPCLGCLQSLSLPPPNNQPAQVVPPSGSMPKLFCPQHAHQAHLMSSFRS